MEITWQSIIILLIIIAMIFVIIGENRNPVKTLAWCLILIFLPVIGIVLYILFGMDTRDKRLIKDEEWRGLKGITARTQQDDINIDVDDQHREMVRLIYKVNDALPLTGNKVEIITDYRTMADRLVEDILSAEKHINVIFYKFENDAAGNRVADALIEKAQEGVEVRFIYDYVGNILVSRRFYRKLRKSGIQVKPFVKLILPILSRDYNSRNHRKVVVVDGKIGYMGGMNIAERYEKGLNWGIWRDTHIRITGPAVSELQTSFLTDWKFVKGDTVDLASMYPQIPACGDATMQIVTGGARSRWDIMLQGYMAAISRSHRYVYIQSPYFIPPEPLLLTLQDAALSGVDVRVMVPYRGDQGVLSPLASESYFSEALAAGVKIYLYRKGFMHAKTLVVDDSFVTIGSTNIDYRALLENFEINAFIYDEALAKEQRDIFLRDQEDAELVTPEKWEKRPWTRKAKESFARVFSELL